MSNGFFQVGDTNPSPGDTQSVLDALGQWSPLLAGAAVVLGLVSVPPAAEPAPTSPLLLLEKLSTDLRHSLYDHLIKNGTWAWWATVLSYIADGIVFSLGLFPAVFFFLMEVFGPTATTIALKLIDQFRKQIDRDVAQISVLVLNELLGSDLTADQLPTGTDLAAHVGRASQIGNLFINTIKGEISSGTDLETVRGAEGAARFAGTIVNFGVATALLGLAGELGTVGLIKDFRLIGEQVSSGLGLSKQMRIAIKPLMKTLVAIPFQWDLNKEFHPQRFSAAEVINPFALTSLPHDVIVKDLELQGWSPDRAELLIKLHQKRFSVDEVELLRRWGQWSDEQATKYVEDLGWPAELVPTVLQLPELKRVDARQLDLVKELETLVSDGHLSIDDFVQITNTLHIDRRELDFIQAIARNKVRVPHKSLTIAEIQSAFDQGLITLDDLDTLFMRQGFTGDDELVLRALTLLKFASREEAIKVAQFAYDKKVAAAKKGDAPIPPPPAILG